MLTEEQKKLAYARHRALEESVSTQRKNGTAEWYEVVWERTLGELSGGKYDSVLGMRLLFEELQAANEKQAFLDSAVVKIISGLGDAENNARFAKEAYDLAEALWSERQRRRQGLPYEPPEEKGIPF